jgi:uncharacterized protein (TIGR02757 family)
VEEEAPRSDGQRLIPCPLVREFHNYFIREHTIKLEEIYKKEKDGLLRIIGNDPVEFVHAYREVRDKEIIGFLASQFAYGRIDVMKKFLRGLFERMGGSPEEFVRRGDWSALDGLYYRFQKGDEIARLFSALRAILIEYGGMGDMLKALYRGDVREAIWGLRKGLFENDNDLIFFFPKPLPQNPLKRWNLFLRWMVREDEIDQGLWGFIDKRDLVVPLDTHLFKIGRCLGWTDRKSPSWNAALDVTAALRQVCPHDPLRYDFLLCHKVGIGAACTGKRTAACSRKCILIR